MTTLNYGITRTREGEEQLTAKLNALLDKLIRLQPILSKEICEPWTRYKIDDIYSLVRELDNERRANYHKLL
jgi:molybdenum-dependent DNA-binding transcriptional regulator ModE